MKTGAAGGLCITSKQRLEEESIYYKNAEQAMSDDYCFKVILYKDEGKVTIELLQSPDEDDDSNAEGDEESNSNQSSRMLRSSAKDRPNGNGKWSENGSSVDNGRLQQAFKENLKNNPLYLNRCLNKSRSVNNQSEEQSESMLEDNGDEENGKCASSTASVLSTADTTSATAAASSSTSSDKECKFNLDNYKTVLVVQNDNVLYRRNALDKALKVSTCHFDDYGPCVSLVRLTLFVFFVQTHKDVSQRKYTKFARWYNKWINSNCRQDTRDRFQSWMIMPDTTHFSPSDVHTSQQQQLSVKAGEKVSPLSVPSSEIKVEESTAPVLPTSSTNAVQAQTNTDKKVERVVISQCDTRPPYRTFHKYRYS